MAVVCALLAQTVRADGSGQSNANGSTLAEVVVKAEPLGKRALQQAANTFTESHATPNLRSGQISHWVMPVCPLTRGLQSHGDDYVSRRILTVAHEVRAPTSAAKNCRANVWILFTRDPQGQVDLFAKKWPTLLGYTSGSLKDLATVRSPIQAWYATGTAGADDPQHVQMDSKFSFTIIPTSAGAQLYNYIVTRQGRYARRSQDVVSQIDFVLVVVNAAKVADYSLDTISDYLAMVVLTRTSLDGCSVLPSIIDLLSPDCGSKDSPQALTDADRAFLKAVYSTQYGLKVNLERGQITHQIVDSLGR